MYTLYCKKVKALDMITDGSQAWTIRSLSAGFNEFA